jgi:hypothetical protein
MSEATIESTEPQQRATYTIVPGLSEGFDVKEGGVTVRRGFETEHDAQKWIDRQTD